MRINIATPTQGNPIKPVDQIYNTPKDKPQNPSPKPVSDNKIDIRV
jgi:hypothetical protein